MEPSRTRLLGLSRKYRALSALRESALASKTTLRSLAQEFPGALRELDILPPAALEQRIHAVSQAERGGPAEPWIVWMLAYHARMRLALAAKQRLRGAGPGDVERIAAVAAALALEFGEQADPTFVARVSAPPGGRLNRLVFELLEQEFGRPRTELENTLFPGNTCD